MCLQVIDSIHEKIAYPLQYGLKKLVPNPEPLFSISEIELRGLYVSGKLNRKTACFYM